MDQPYIIVLSNASKNTYKSNSTIKFVNAVPRKINNNKEEYQIALQSLFLDNNFGNIPSSIIYSKGHHFIVFDSIEKLYDNRPTCVMNIKKSAYELKQLIHSLNKQNDHLIFGTYSHEGKRRLLFKVTNKIVVIRHDVSEFLGFSNENDTGETIIYHDVIHNNVNYVAIDCRNRNYIVKSIIDFRVEKITPQVIKVKLQEMKQSLSAKNFHQDLSIIIDDKLTGTPFFHVVKRKEYFDLIGGEIDSLSISLTDENDFPLCLREGHPTIIKLKSRKKMLNSFILRVSSEDSKTIFKSNTNSKFMIQLPQTVPSKKKWEVALSSIYFPSKININQILTSEDFWIEFTSDKILSVRVSFKYLQDVVTVEKIIEAIERQTARLDLVTIVKHADEPNYYVYFKKAGFVKMSNLFAYCLGRTFANNEIEGKAESQIALGIFDLNKSYPGVMLLSCNFISPIIVGEKMRKILKIIPCQFDDNVTMVKHDVQHLDFLRVSMNDSSLLEFELFDSSERVIKFENVDDIVYINLIFREMM